MEVDLLVRGICRLRPGIEGVSENIRVYSVVGRFLEHSRIYYFQDGGEPEFYVGSADWMTRNLDHRVEAVAPIESANIQSELWFILETMLSDNRRRWKLNSRGSYDRIRPSENDDLIGTPRD